LVKITLTQVSFQNKMNNYYKQFVCHLTGFICSKFKQFMANKLLGEETSFFFSRFLMKNQHLKCLKEIFLRDVLGDTCMLRFAKIQMEHF